jgi:hypothetical protein
MHAGRIYGFKADSVGLFLSLYKHRIKSGDSGLKSGYYFNPAMMNRKIQWKTQVHPVIL